MPSHAALSGFSKPLTHRCRSIGGSRIPRYEGYGIGLCRTNHGVFLRYQSTQNAGVGLDKDITKRKEEEVWDSEGNDEMKELAASMAPIHLPSERRSEEADTCLKRNGQRNGLVFDKQEVPTKSSLEPPVPEFVKWRPKVEYDRKRQFVRRGLSPAVSITEALKAVDCHDVLPMDTPVWKKNLSRNKSSSRRANEQLTQNLLSSHCSSPSNRFGLIVSKFIRADGLRDPNSPYHGDERSGSIPNPDEQGSRPTAHTGKPMLAPEKILQSADRAFLQKRGFAPADTRIWAHIIMEKSTERAALALHRKSITVGGVPLSTNREIPRFVLISLLHRKYVSAPALRHLLSLTWDALHLRLHHALQSPDLSSFNPENPENGTPVSSEGDASEIIQESFNVASDGDAQDAPRAQSQTGGALDGPTPSKHGDSSIVNVQTAFVLFVRLFRHARIVWAAGLVNISALVATFLLPRDGHGLPLNLTVKQLARRTELCNTALRLLSIETSINPMKSAVYQQRAIFDLIRAMHQYHPQLPVTRDGYHALTTVLLRLKKTPQERDWASLKSKSWPPFKESKTRLDDAKDLEYGLSRAAQAIRFMQEYGYEMEPRDMIAQTLSGWHPDGSPTIQVRAQLERDHPLSLRGSNTPSGDITEVTEPNQIAALIEATRTLEEAWACFLEYQQSVDQRSPAPYFSLLRKIVAHRENQRKIDVERPAVLKKNPTADCAESIPGDGRETVKASESPAEAVYIPRPPPAFEEVIRLARRDEVRFTERQINFLASNAPTLEMGLHIWRFCGKPLPGFLEGAFDIYIDNHLEPFPLGRSRETASPRTANNTRRFPELTGQQLASLLTLVCRFSDDRLWFNFRYGGRTILKGRDLRINHGMGYALHLLRHYKPNYRPAWIPILKGMTESKALRNVSFAHFHNKRLMLSVLALNLVDEVIEQMNYCHVSNDAVTFSYICVCVGQSVLYLSSVAHDSGKSLPEAMKEFDSGHWSTSLRLRKMFAELVGVENTVPGKVEQSLPSSVPPIPTILNTPNPAELHHYIRALGAYGDHEGMLSLVKWMVQVSDELGVWIDAELNGQWKFRKLLVSIAVMLEAPEKTLDTPVVLKPASVELIELVKREVESVAAWGGWASEFEIDRYCRTGRQ